jgi:hypothetical protein
VVDVQSQLIGPNFEKAMDTYEEKLPAGAKNSFDFGVVALNHALWHLNEKYPLGLEEAYRTHKLSSKDTLAAIKFPSYFARNQFLWNLLIDKKDG